MKKICYLLIVVLLLGLMPAYSAQSAMAEEVQKLVIGELTFNPVANELSARAELVTETGSAPAQGQLPENGTLVLAAYRRGELVALNTSAYTNIYDSLFHWITLKIDSSIDICVKAFVVDSLSHLIPLALANECNDVSQIITYDDIIIPDDFVIKNYHNFEPDVRCYDSQVDSYTMQLVPNDEANSVEICSDGSGNSYLSIRVGNGAQSHPFAVLSCGNLQRLVVEFDMWSPQFSKCNFSLYDTTNKSLQILTADTSGTLKHGSNVIGSLSKDGWQRIAIAIDNEQKSIDFYVNSEPAGTFSVASSSLDCIRAMRISGRNDDPGKELMFDNLVAYTGTTLRDFSQTFSGAVDETAVIYNHNTAGVEEFFESFSAINTSTFKLYAGGFTTAEKIPEYRDGILYVSLPDAERLVHGTVLSSSDEMISLDTYAQEHGKKVTYTKTGTVIVGNKTALLSDKMIKYVNAYMTYDRPSTSNLEASFEGQRPRLTLTPQKLEQIKTAYSNSTNAYITEWCGDIIADADKYLKIAPQVFVEPVGQAGRLLVPAKTIKERVQKLAIAYHLTKKSEYAERAWTEIENACNFPNWHQGIHELDSSTMASAIAYGYDWLYDYWLASDESRLNVMEDAIYANQLDQAYEVYHGSRPYGWAVTANNWNAVCNGYTALSACAVYESSPHKCADIISNAISNFESALVEFYPNGSWKEGTGYWGGTVGPYTEVFTTIKTLFGSYYNLHNTSSFDTTANFMFASSGPVGNNNYNDADFCAYSTSSTMHWFAQMYSNPSLTTLRLKEIDDGIVEAGILDLCYYNPDSVSAEIALPLDVYYERLELAALRSSYTDANASYVSFHSGNNLNGAAHSHIDSGTFVMDMLGERFAFDPGSHYYYTTGHGQAPDTQPEDDGDTITRWDYYHHVPEGHNCFIINPDLTIGQNIVTDDKMEDFYSGDDTAYAITSLSSAYEGYAKSARRGIMLSDMRKCVTVRDEIELNDGENEIYWFMHKSIDNEIEMLDDTSFIMTQNGKRVKVMFVTNADTAQVYVAEAKHMVRTPPAEQEEITDLNKLVIKMTASDNVYLQVKFIPLDGTTDDISIENISLDNWRVN